MLRRVFLISSITGVLISVCMPSKAETCIPMQLVGGEGSEVTKTVSQPTIPGPFGIKITRNNWNTDWAVPGGRSFSRFVMTVVSQDGGSFDMRMYLKYSDQTSEQVYNQDGTTLAPGKPLTIQAKIQGGDQPYQINLFVNGVASMGKTYTANLVGCM